jgi:hypothetical protein
MTTSKKSDNTNNKDGESFPVLAVFGFILLFFLVILPIWYIIDDYRAAHRYKRCVQQSVTTDKQSEHSSGSGSGSSQGGYMYAHSQLSAL